MSSTNRKHDWLVNKIYNTPSLVGIYNPISKTDEYVMLYKDHYFVVPDLYFKTPEYESIVEVKSENEMLLYSKGMRQLERIVEWHELNGLPEPDTQLILPRKSNTRHWIDMLDALDSYQLGDMYQRPSRQYHR